MYRSELILPASAAEGDQLERLMYKVQQTQLTGPGVMELLQIACNLQQGLTKEVRIPRSQYDLMLKLATE